MALRARAPRKPIGPLTGGAPPSMVKSTGQQGYSMRALAIALLFSAVLMGQEFRGTFSGTVTDSQGGAIVKAKVVATETRTGAKSETTSETSGAYTIPFLAPGDYELSAEAPGFKKF